MSNKKGFTLIELLIVIVIIGILSVAVVPRVLDYPKKARDATRKQALAGLQTSMSLILSENKVISGVTADASGCFDASALATALKPYLNNNIPVDPSAQKYFSGATSCNNYWYVIDVDANNNVLGYAFIAVTEVNSGNYAPVGDGAPGAGAADLALSGSTSKYYAIKQVGI